MAQPQNSNSDWRNQEIVIDPFVYQIAAGILLIIVATLIGFAIFPDDKGYLTNLYTTGIGVLITVAYLDRRAERRESLRTEADLKARLIREMSSQVNEVAIHAVEELSAKGWLYDGTLRGITLSHANLQGAKLEYADLQDSNLIAVNLKKSDLSYTNLKNSKLISTNLDHAYLPYSNLENIEILGGSFQQIYLAYSNLKNAYLASISLQEAEMSSTNLTKAKLDRADFFKANLYQANMQGSDLWAANLQEANLNGVLFNENTCLPSGGYTPHIDIKCFTDPNHPQFWRSDDPGSPAYRGSKNDLRKML